MIKPALRNCFIALFAGVVALAGAQITKQSSGYLFRAHYTKGQSATYTVNSTGSMQTVKVSSTLTISEKVLSVANGIGTIEVRTGKTKVLINGKPFGKPTGLDNMKKTVRLDSLAKSAEAGMTVQTHIELPTKAIPIGGSWAASATAVASAGQMQQMQASYKFVGFDTVAGTRVAKLSVTLKGSGTASLTGGGTAWISVADSSLVKESLTMEATAQGFKIPATVLVVRK